MPQTESTFADHATEAVPTEAPTGIQVGDRNFTTQEELVKSWTNAQEHIQTLESESLVAKEALSRAKGVEEVLERLQSSTVAPSQTETKEAVNEGYLTEERLIETLNKREHDKITSSNVDTAMTLAKNALGTDYIAKLDAKAAELSIPTAAAISLAKDSPEAFAKLFLPDAPMASASSIGDINTAAIAPSAQVAPSAKVEIGATSSDLVAAWNAAKPNL